MTSMKDTRGLMHEDVQTRRKGLKNLNLARRDPTAVLQALRIYRNVMLSLSNTVTTGSVIYTAAWHAIRTIDFIGKLVTGQPAYFSDVHNGQQ